MAARNPAPALTIQLFGPFEVRVNGHPLSRLRFRKSESVLALLALRHGGEVDRGWLAGLLWPESRDSQALRNCLTDLRRALGEQACRLHSPTPHTLRLDLTDAAVDVAAFDAAIERGDPGSLEQAVALFRGPLLEGCVEEWAFQERQAREQIYLAARERLAALALEQGEVADAERHLRLAVAVDPLRESTQRALMQVLAASGNFAGALLCYRELRLRLHRELNVEPDAETQTLFQQLRKEGRRLAAKGAGAGLGPAVAVLGRDPGTFGARAVSPQSARTVTFLFTDIEGSSQLWEADPEGMKAALARHDALLRQAIEHHAGQVFKTVGDGFCAVFATAPEAVAAALEAQQVLQAEEWEGFGQLRVRMALHTGAADEREGDYFGPPLNRAARLLDAGHGGQVLLSQATQELAQDGLPEGAGLRDLGEHRLPGLTRPERIFQLVALHLTADFPPLRSLARTTHNLPAELTSFIGREREIAEVRQLLTTTRLLTLTGAGGCGKTRLALQVAGDRMEQYTHGVWLVELAALADPALVPQTVAGALGVREEPGRPFSETLTGYLHTRQLLLVLDNCEHLLTSCAQLVTTLLRACPELHILATSREGLCIAGETTYRVPSLTLPDLQRLPSPEALTQFDAVRLFVDRAAAALPSFVLDERNVPTVAAVCRRLDGIPLALELAAARVKALPVEEISSRLDDRFRLLTGGSRTALPRQQTLRALIDWSYDLLSEMERVLLRRLSVFAGGWTLDSAEAVCAGEGIEAWEVLDLLTTLVEKSLVIYEAQAGMGRYRLLETVRQYARDRLLEAPQSEAGSVRDRHLDYFLRLAEQAEPEMEGPDLVPWLDRLETELDNLRAALEWSKSAEGGTEIGLRLAGALREFWVRRDHQSEGREWLEGALAAEGDTGSPAVRAGALLGLGALRPFTDLAWRSALQESLDLFRQLDNPQGISRALIALAFGAGHHEWQHIGWQQIRVLSEEALVNARQAGNRYLVVRALSLLGDAAREQGDHRRAAALLDEGLALGRQLGNPWVLAWSSFERGRLAQQQGEQDQARALVAESEALFRQLGTKWVLSRMLQMWAEVLSSAAGDHQAAEALLEESVAISRELQDRNSVAWRLLSQGHAARWQGEDERARDLYQESLAIGTEQDEKPVIAWALVNIGLLDVRQGALAVARTRACESLAIWRELGDNMGVVRCLECLAQVAYAQGELERMARLFGAAGALREAIQWPLTPADSVEYGSVPAARAALGKQAFEAAWAAGRQMTVEQAIAEALQDDPDACTDAGAPSLAVPHGRGREEQERAGGAR